MSYGDPYLNPHRDPSDPVEHVWVTPPSEPCPDCPCCSKRLCERALDRDAACHWEGGQSHGYDLRWCPCWHREEKGRARAARVQALKTESPYRSYAEIVRQVLGEMLPGGGAA